MHVAYALLVSFIVTAFAANAAGDIIHTAINPENGHTYHLLDTATWTASQAEAAILGGVLATVRSETENNWLYSTFISVRPSATGFWIGLSDVEEEGVFKWVSGEPLTYTNWGGMEPNNNGPFGEEDYGYIVTEPFLALIPSDWNDVSNLETNRFGIVEITSVPEPSGLPFTVLVLLPIFKRLRTK